MYNKLSTYQTEIDVTAESGTVKYRDTVIVSWGKKGIVLQNNGWKTVTTKRKMNQASIQFGLNFSVYQENFEWYVKKPDGETVEFIDGMSFKR